MNDPGEQGEKVDLLTIIVEMLGPDDEIVAEKDRRHNRDNAEEDLPEPLALQKSKELAVLLPVTGDIGHQLIEIGR